MATAIVTVTASGLGAKCIANIVLQSMAAIIAATMATITVVVIHGCDYSCGYTWLRIYGCGYTATATVTVTDTVAITVAIGIMVAVPVTTIDKPTAMITVSYRYGYGYGRPASLRPGCFLLQRWLPSP